MGDVTDLSNFMGAVIDDRAFAKHKAALERAKDDDSITVVAGGTCDDSEGYFVRPTVLESSDPDNEIFTTEYFGPILGVHVYDDSAYDAMLAQMESVAPYALTGSIIAQDRAAVAHAQQYLRFAAGNFYVNDKPTGAVVGQQPFGGARASGTNDKAGAPQNLMRWTSTRSIKETLAPPSDHTLPAHGLSPTGPRQRRGGRSTSPHTGWYPAASTARSEAALPGATWAQTGSPAGTSAVAAIASRRPSPWPRAAGSTSKAVSQRPARPRPTMTWPAPPGVRHTRTSSRYRSARTTLGCSRTSISSRSSARSAAWLSPTSVADSTASIDPMSAPIRSARATRNRAPNGAE